MKTSNILPAKSQALPAPELLSCVTQPGLEVFQITTDPEVESNLQYNAQQAFEATSRFMLIRQVEKGLSKLTIVDLNEGLALIPVGDAADRLPAAVHQLSGAFTPDGQHVVFPVFRDDFLVIRRWSLNTGKTEDLFNEPIAREELDNRRILSTKWISFSHDGKRLLQVVSVEGKEKYYSMALLIFDMEKQRYLTTIETGPRNWNNKSQYAPCFGPDGDYLISVCDCYSSAWIDQEELWHCDKMPECAKGGSLYLINEAGDVKYVYAVGRDHPNQNVSHHQWFGKSIAQVFHCDAFDQGPVFRGCILLSDPVPADEQSRHLGRHHPQANQLDLTRNMAHPDVYHLCVSDDAQHLVCDTMALGYPQRPDDLRSTTRYIYGCTVKNDQAGAYVEAKAILTPYSSWKPYGAECIPCMTPDKKWIFFASDYPGVNGYNGNWHTPQLFAVRNFEFPK